MRVRALAFVLPVLDMGLTFTLVPASANGLEEMVVRVEKVPVETW